MNLEGKWDYVAKRPYRNLRQVIRACNAWQPDNPEEFWSDVNAGLEAVSTYAVVARRINPYSPNTYFVAFASEDDISPSDQLNVVREASLDKAKAICALFNSAIFLAYLFLSKEETTGRYIDIRLYDLHEIPLFPSDNTVPALAKVYDDFAQRTFSSLREQLDEDFDRRYEEFWSKNKGQPSLLNMPKDPIRPSQERLAFDLAVTDALGVPVTETELRDVYGAIVREMIITRGLQRD